MLATDGTWKNVNDDGTFSFMPMNLPNNPVYLEGLSLFFNVDHYETWGAAITPTPPNGGCNNGGNQTIAYGFTEDSDQPIRSPQSILSNVRPMPTFNGSGRLGAARINDNQGRRLVYGASTDRYCFQTNGGDGWKGAEILLTVVQ